MKKDCDSCGGRWSEIPGFQIFCLPNALFKRQFAVEHMQHSPDEVSPERCPRPVILLERVMRGPSTSSIAYYSGSVVACAGTVANAVFAGTTSPNKREMLAQSEVLHMHNAVVTLLLVWTGCNPWPGCTDEGRRASDCWKSALSGACVTSLPKKGPCLLK